MKQLMSNFKGYYKELILGPVFKLTEAVFELFVPLIMARMIDIGIANKDTGYIIQNGLLLVLLGALGLAAALTCQYFASRVAQGFGYSLRKKLFHHVFRLSEREYGKIGTDSLITRLTNDVNQVQTGVNMFIRLAIRAPFLAIGSIIMAMTINLKIGLIFLVSTPLIVLVLYIIMNRSVPFYGRIQQKQDRISRLAGENLEGVRVIRAFSKQESEIRQFDQTGNELADVTIRVGKISAALNPITYVIVNLAIVAIVWMGSQYANLGILASGDITALVNYMSQTLLALIVLANLIVLFTKAIASAKRVCEVLDLQPSMAAPEQTPTAPGSEEKIRFQDVCFSYHGTENALEGITFSLGRGQTLGIIGGTGCGKTTLVQLLNRFYDVGSGSISVDGIPVQDYRLEDLRGKIGLVPQAARLFSGTLRENLKIADPEAGDTTLWHALEVAQGKEFAEALPDGLDTRLDEGGKNLSGGQKQRLTIARALVKDPEILVLDDSASALDYATDAALRRALKAENRERTVLMISQRASTIKNADRILVLDDGCQAGLGTHEELLASCPVYREICESQGLITKEADA